MDSVNFERAQGSFYKLYEQGKNMSKTISNEDLIQQLKWRYAVKRFDPTKKVSEADWKALEESLVLSPSSYGLQPWKFYVVTDEAVKKELQPHAWNQPQIVEASHLVVIAARKDAHPEDVEKYIDRIVEVRGTKREDLEAMKGMILNSQKTAAETGYINQWSARQCYIALGTLLTSAAVLGIDACPMEGFVPAEFDRILGIDKDDYQSVLVCAIGYRDSEHDWLSKLPKVRFEKNEVVKHI
jgi:nitroreductase